MKAEKLFEVTDELEGIVKCLTEFVDSEQFPDADPYQELTDAHSLTSLNCTEKRSRCGLV